MDVLPDGELVRISGLWGFVTLPGHPCSLDDSSSPSWGDQNPFSWRSRSFDHFTLTVKSTSSA